MASTESTLEVSEVVLEKKAVSDASNRIAEADLFSINVASCCQSSDTSSVEVAQTDSLDSSSWLERFQTATRYGRKEKLKRLYDKAQPLVESTQSMPSSFSEEHVDSSGVQSLEQLIDDLTRHLVSGNPSKQASRANSSSSTSSESDARAVPHIVRDYLIPSLLGFACLLLSLGSSWLSSYEYWERGEQVRAAATIAIAQGVSFPLFIKSVFNLFERPRTCICRLLVSLWIHLIFLPVFNLDVLLEFTVRVCDSAILLGSAGLTEDDHFDLQGKVMFKNLMWVATLSSFPQAVYQLFCMLTDISNVPGKMHTEQVVAITSSIVTSAYASVQFGKISGCLFSQSSRRFSWSLCITEHFSWCFLMASRCIVFALFAATFPTKAYLLAIMYFLHVLITIFTSLTYLKTPYNFQYFVQDVGYGSISVFYYVDRNRTSETIAKESGIKIYLALMIIVNTVLTIPPFIYITEDVFVFVVLLVHYLLLGMGAVGIIINRKIQTSWNYDALQGQF